MLGSITTKAVVLDENRNVLGQGITNSRSNYDIAAQVAKQEALVTARFTLFRRALADVDVLEGGLEDFLDGLEGNLRLEQFLEQLDDLEATVKIAERGLAAQQPGLPAALDEIFAQLRAEAPALYTPGAQRKSDFFRDFAGSRYLAVGEAVAKDAGVSYDTVVNVYDRSIIEVENRASAESDKLRHALARSLADLPDLEGRSEVIRAPIDGIPAVPLEEAYVVGTGHGRARLPFSKEHIRSGILCHGLGAHVMFPGTAKVLDIGGQDTKAIQVDPEGIVENFQMNNRCAAGCGRYLGYIADEMNVGVHELGPIAMQVTRQVRINLTCTVFAGAELRDRLALGEKREDVLAGLHRAIVLRAMSILARSGGIRDQFTWPGCVAKNAAAAVALQDLVAENYGDLAINIDPDSI